MLNERDKLICLIMKANSPLISLRRAEELADCLFNNDVVAVVRCKDCKSCDKFYPSKRIGEEPELEYFCEKEKRTTRPDDFCSYGKRKDGVEK